MQLDPLFQQNVKDTDTPEIIERALAIAAEHIYYIGQPMGEPARFATYATEEDKKIAAKHKTLNNPVFILVPENSWYAVHRFNASIKMAREEAKQKAK
jgi:hypothetical protein